MQKHSKGKRYVNLKLYWLRDFMVYYIYIHAKCLNMWFLHFVSLSDAGQRWPSNNNCTKTHLQGRRGSLCKQLIRKIICPKTHYVGSSTLSTVFTTRLTIFQVTISYVDEELPYKERQTLLADYGFRCRCTKCMEEEPQS